MDALSIQACAPICRREFPVRDYDLAETLDSGQSFRWRQEGGWWAGVIGNRFVRLRMKPGVLVAETASGVSEWDWLQDYLQLGIDLNSVLETFPDDAPMRAAVAGCRGLRLLRQDPWECLASFILSATKQIVQIRQIVETLCERYGEPVPVPAGHAPRRTFPSAARLAQCAETELRDCKMGFRAPALLDAARKVASGQLVLHGLHGAPLGTARAELMKLRGVGPKIADCVLLFAYDFPAAFPVDVWVIRALRRLYFPGRSVKLPRLLRFVATHFGPNAGYAQQYLFHYMRTKHANSDENTAQTNLAHA